MGQTSFNTSGSWSTASNWNNGLPDSTDAVTIGTTNNANGSRTCSLTVNGFATTINLNGNSSLLGNINRSNLYLYGTNMGGSSSIIDAGNGTVSLDSVSVYIMKNGAQMNDNLTANQIFVKGTNFTVKSGTLTVHDSMVISGTGASFLNNSTVNVGTLVIQGSGVSFQPQGSLNVISNLTVQEGATVSSTGNSTNIQYSSSATLVIEAGSMDASTFDEIWPSTSGPTNVVINVAEGDTFTMPASRTVEGTLTLSGGSLQGGENITLGDSAEIVLEGGSIDSVPASPNRIDIRYASTTDTVIFTSNEIPSDSSRIGNVVVNTGARVVLTKKLFVNDTLKLVNGYLEAGNYNVELGNSSTNTAGSSLSYIRTNGSGKVIARANSGGRLFPIGFNPYLPVTILSTGNEKFAVSVDSGVLMSDASGYFTKNAVNRTWSISSEQNASNVSITFQWGNEIDSLQYFNANNCAIAYTYGGSNDWIRTQSKAAASGSRDAYTRSITMDFTAGTVYEFYIYSDTFEADYVNANVKLMLEGAYNSSAGTMTTALRSGNSLGSNNIIPSAQPYNSAPWNYAGTENVDTANHPSNTVDWVLVELRSTYNGSPVANGQAAGFLLSDGSIVDTNGTDAIRFWNITPGYYYVVVKHRNHLPIMTADSIYLSNASSLYDFTSGQGQAYGTDTTTFQSKPMSALGDGRYGMRAGDCSGTTYQIRYNGGGMNDRTWMLSVVGGNNNSSTPINNSYDRCDVNLDRQVRYNGGGLNDRTRLLNWVGGNSNSGSPINSAVPNP